MRGEIPPEIDYIQRTTENRRVPPQKSGPVAQLGARFHGMEEVIGSIPIRSTKFSPVSGLPLLFLNGGVRNPDFSSIGAAHCSNAPDGSRKAIGQSSFFSATISAQSAAGDEAPGRIL